MFDGEVLMELFKSRVVVPVDRQTFRKGMLKYFGLQLGLITVFLLLMKSDFASQATSLYFIFGLLLLFGVISFFTQKQCDYSGRFKDIYPDYELKNWFLFLMGFMPLFYFPVAIFLCVKEKAVNKTPWKIFIKFPNFLMIAIPLLALQISSPRFAYWIANPSLYYIVDILDGTAKIIQLKEKLANTPGYESAVDQYLSTVKTSLNSTQLVLLTAVSASNVLSKKPQEKTADDLRKIETNVNYSILLLKETNKIISLGEQTKFNFSDYSLIQWLHPSGVIEIMLLTAVEMGIKDKCNYSLVDRTIGVLQNLENGMAKLPAETQAFYRPDITKIKAEMMNSKTYKSLSNSNFR